MYCLWSVPHDQPWGKYPVSIHHIITPLLLYRSSSAIILLDGHKQRKKTAPKDLVSQVVLVNLGLFFCTRRFSSWNIVKSVLQNLPWPGQQHYIIIVPAPRSVIANILHISSLWLIGPQPEKGTHTFKLFLADWCLIKGKVNETDIDTHTYGEGNWFLQNTRRSKGLL